MPMCKHCDDKTQGYNIRFINGEFICVYCMKPIELNKIYDEEIEMEEKRFNFTDGNMVDLSQEAAEAIRFANPDAEVVVENGVVIVSVKKDA